MTIRFIEVTEIESARKQIARMIERAMKLAIKNGNTDNADRLSENIIGVLTKHEYNTENLPIADPCGLN